jgi:uncharacterized protein DUF2158
MGRGWQRGAGSTSPDWMISRSPRPPARGTHALANVKDHSRKLAGPLHGRRLGPIGRPQWLCQHAATLIIAKLDRLARNVHRPLQQRATPSAAVWPGVLRDRMAAPGWRCTVRGGIEEISMAVKVGDVVKLKSDGPMMTVVEVRSAPRGRVEDGRGRLGHAATLRFPSPLIEPDLPISGIGLSDWLHREAHGVTSRGVRSRGSTPRSP